MPKVSVIVPVYNVEAYVEKCLKTLVEQTLEDIEIIVVNDGSTDKSKEIIQKMVDYQMLEIMGCPMQKGSTLLF